MTPETPNEEPSDSGFIKDSPSASPTHSTYRTVSASLILTTRAHGGGEGTPRPKGAKG